MYQPFAWFAVLLLFSCNTPEIQLGRLQHSFGEQFAKQDFFEVQFKKEVLLLPLPPNAMQSGELKTSAEALQKVANSIETKALNATQQKQLLQIRAALEDCVTHAGNPLFDPSRCAISAKLQQYSEHAELAVLLENIPNYYARVEQSWQTPDSRFVDKAVTESQIALDLLKKLEENSKKELIGQARAAVKDFIGLCQSTVLE
ncbi:MAG: hypothetical protein Q7U74_13835 [Saprospiraceae bacterium]|nr:hypothetical protein [Saprospiraceae bacterium]